MVYNQFLSKRITGLSEVWYRAWFGTKRPWVRIPQPGPGKALETYVSGAFSHFLDMFRYILVYWVNKKVNNLYVVKSIDSNWKGLVINGKHHPEKEERQSHLL